MHPEQSIIDSDFDRDAALQVVMEVVTRTGLEVLRIREDNALVVDVKPGHHSNIVTQADRVSEEMIVSTLRAAFPDHAIRGEEGTAEKGNAQFEWIIDPIDGTINFSHGSENFGISVGLLHRGVPVLGVIYFPALRKTMYAMRGRGAFLDGKPLHVTPLAQELRDAVINFDFPAAGKRSDVAKKYFEPLADAVRYPRLEACYVKAVLDIVRGISDGYVHPAATPFDIAAAILIAEEAGCTVSGLHEPIDFTQQTIGTIIAKSKKLHDQLLDLLKP